jgi:16S rRNA processing protein RimM
MVLVGAITGAHGIRGEVKLRSFTADPAAIATYSPLETAKGARIEIAASAPRRTASSPSSRV